MPLIQCNNLTKAYGKKLALDHIDLVINGGRILGLAGPNGSGKTTLIKLLQGLILPTQGEIFIDRMKPGPKTRALVSYLPDRDVLPSWMKLSDVIRFYEKMFPDFDTNKAYSLISDVGIDPGLQLGKMSKGNGEKAQLILCMSRRAEIYLLDEPIAAVDPAARDYILRTIIGSYNENSLLIMSTHLIADVENVLDDVIFLREGQVLLYEPVDELRERTGKSVDQYFREVFRCL